MNFPERGRIEPVLRALSLAGALCIIGSLFYVGAKPVAVGLFPPPWDKVAHFTVYGLIAALLWYGLFRRHPLWLIAIVSVVGVADELHQRTVPGRFPGLDDLAADIVAAIMITGLLEWFRRRKKRSG